MYVIEAFRVRSTTNSFVFVVNSELEVSPKTFKVYRFAGRLTAIPASVENILNKEHEQHHQQQNNHNMQNGNQSLIYQV